MEAFFLSSVRRESSDLEDLFIAHIGIYIYNFDLDEFKYLNCLFIF